jgi:hypothetical protein
VSSHVCWSTVVAMSTNVCWSTVVAVSSHVCWSTVVAVSSHVCWSTVVVVSSHVCWSTVVAVNSHVCWSTVVAVSSHVCWSSSKRTSSSHRNTISSRHNIAAILLIPVLKYWRPHAFLVTFFWRIVYLPQLFVVGLMSYLFCICLRMVVSDIFVLLYIFTFLVPCCNVHYDVRMKTMFGSSLDCLLLVGPLGLSNVYFLCIELLNSVGSKNKTIHLIKKLYGRHYADIF